MGFVKPERNGIKHAGHTIRLSIYWHTSTRQVAHAISDHQVYGQSCTPGCVHSIQSALPNLTKSSQSPEGDMWPERDGFRHAVHTLGLSIHWHTSTRQVEHAISNHQIHGQSQSCTPGCVRSIQSALPNLTKSSQSPEGDIMQPERDGFRHAAHTLGISIQCHTLARQVKHASSNHQVHGQSRGKACYVRSIQSALPNLIKSSQSHGFCEA